MRSPVRRLVRTTQSMVSQIVVSVAAAVSVAFITGAYLSDGSTPDVTGAATRSAAETPAAPANGGLPPLDVEVIADVPAGLAPGQEIFPGAPVGIRPEALQQAAAGEEPKPHRRRFLGIPIPFTSTTTASDIAEDRVSGG
jgi:hypothetical protein